MRLHTVGLIVMLALSIRAAPLAAGALPAGKVYRIGVLETTSAALNIPNLDAFRQGLRKSGTSRGRTSSSRTDRLTAAPSASRTWPLNWYVCRWT